MFVPKEALQEAHKKLENTVRLKFVVYYNDKLFQPKKLRKPASDVDKDVEEQKPNENAKKEKYPISKKNSFIIRFK